MHTISVTARKGGVGKSTVTIHLAVIAQQEGLKVAIIDTDPQGSAAGWWNEREGDTPSMLQCAPKELADVKNLARSEGYDLLIIDTEPSHSSDLASVAKASDFVLIPTRPAPLDLRAIGPTVTTIHAHKKRSAILLNGCPPGRNNSEANITQEARELLIDSPIPVAPVSITLRAPFSHSLINGSAVTEWDPEGKASTEITALWNWIKQEMQNA